MASTSTSTGYGDDNKYGRHIFINHRGADVKKTLARDLYNGLREHGLRVFLDDEELWVGEKSHQIEWAIRTASVHIAIISLRYAESTCCLDELRLMLESGSVILPIFYGVKPSDLRWTLGTDGVYARALQKLEKKKTFDQEPRYDSDTIAKWRKALSDVAKITGFELVACKSDEEQLVEREQLVEQVVERVLKIVPTSPHVSKHPIGLDEILKDLQEVLLQQKSKDVKVIGILGMVGVGKTTVAKEFFNHQRSNYKRSCLLFDARAKSLNSLLSLQSRLLKDLAQMDMQISSTHEGQEMLRKYLTSSQSLVIIDDVDHVEQLDALLLPLNDVLHSDSLILYTSRNEKVLTNSAIQRSPIYRLTGLYPQHSRELFCTHAFGQPYPEVGFEKVTEEFLGACQELPLSLKVLGALLRGKKDLNYWEAQLYKISKILPYDIHSILKISYDSLDEEEKHIFLDVVCFFIGRHMASATRLCGRRLLNLEDKCLLEVDSENCIKMHDAIGELGRDIAERECQETRQRLWRIANNLHNDLPKKSTARAIQMLETSVELGDSLLGMGGLELVTVAGDCLDERTCGSVQSQYLIWLRWDGCPYSCLPSWIPMDRLGILQVGGHTALKTLWEDHEAPLQLRELIINVASLLKIPKSIEKLKHLEKFVLHPNEGGHTVDLETLPDEFCQLQCLEHLELTSCSKLKSLPYSFGNLRNLRHLDLSGCSNLEMLPVSFGELRNLQHINLSKCSNLDMLPYFVGNLRNLQHINLSECSNLQLLPNSLENLKKLQYIDLSGCSKLQMLPNFFGNIRNLQHIDLSRCHNLQMLPNSFGKLTNLQHVDLSSCSSLPILPNSFGNLIQLKYLCLRNCYDLSIYTETLGKIRTLEWIEISGCYGIESLPPQVAHQPFLREMYLFCPYLKELPIATGKLSNLEILHLGSSCLELLEIETLVSLKELSTRECVKLKSIQGLVQLTKLRRLDVANCSELEQLEGVEHLSSLEELNASECPKLKWDREVLKQLQQELKECITI